MDEIALFYTAEARWFIEGRLPPAAVEWFAPDPEGPSTRVDRYLLLPGSESVGVKEREGRFEIKARWGTQGIVRYAEEAVGRSEGWVKWSYSRPAVHPWIEALRLEPQGWIEVEKTRRMVHFGLDTGVPVRMMSQEQPSEGCTIELTAVNARSQDWWTVGLEAYGTQSRLHRNLLAAGTHFFLQDDLPTPFRITQSCAYPAWLNLFA